jgi:hypothetical protein
MSSVITKKFFGFCIILAVIFTAGFIFARNYLSQKPPILYKYKDKAAVDPSSELFVIFNPFRDKTPEVEAENFLEMLREGKCERFKSIIRIDCERENNKDIYALTSWNLINREENDNKIKLHYSVNRASYKGGLGNVWITLDNESDTWKVADYESWY